MKISILTSCHNQKSFIKDCINSVLNQSYTNWEHIVVDDCSTDGSQELIEQLKHPKLIFIKNSSRKFCSSSYAIALKQASGDICGVVDGDDKIVPNAMEIIASRYKKYPDIDFIYTQHYWCDATLSSMRKGLSSAPKKGKSLAEMVLSGKHCFSHWRTFKRKLADRGILFPEGLEVSVDKNLGFVLERLGHGAFLDKILYIYRYYKGNMSLLQGSRQKQTSKELAKKMIINNAHCHPIRTIK